MGKEEKKITRRDYLKYTGAAIGGLAVGGALGYVLKPSEVIKETVTAPGVEKTVTTTLKETITKTLTAAVTPTYSAYHPPKKVELYWLVRDYNEAEAKEFLKGFYEKYPNIRIGKLEPQTWKGLYEKLVTLLSSRTGPDVCEGYSPRWIAPFYKRGYLYRLNEFFELLPDETIPDVCPGKKGFFEKAIEAVTMADGTLAGLPNRMDGYMLYWNVKLFEEAGLPKRPPKTWDEFRDFAKNLCKDDPATGKRVRWGAGAYYTPAEEIINHFLGGKVWGDGGDFISSDFKECLATSSEVIEAYKFFIDMHLKDDAWWPPMTTATYQDFAAALAQGIIGMTFAPSVTLVDALTKLGLAWDDWGLSDPPAGRVARYTAMSGNVWAISSFCKEPRAAWELIVYMAEPKRMAALTVTQVAHRDALKVPKYERLKDDPLKKDGYYGSIPLINSKSPLYKIASYYDIVTLYTKAFEACWEGANVEEKLRFVKAEGDKILKKEFGE